MFSEIYGCYYQTVAKIIDCALKNELNYKTMNEIIRNNALAESGAAISHSLLSGKWPFITSDYQSLLRHHPSMPLTNLEKRWMKALLSDDRIQLFDIDPIGLDDVTPLFSKDDIVLFDKNKDGDDYKSPNYQLIFRESLEAAKTGHVVKVNFISKNLEELSFIGIIQTIEYSEKDDKFRLVMQTSKAAVSFVNISSIQSIEECSDIAFSVNEQSAIYATVQIELKDTAQALERCMMHFSDLKKETIQINENTYRITLYYFPHDLQEIIMRILSFGSNLKVISPDSIIDEIQNRLRKQYHFSTGNISNQ